MTAPVELAESERAAIRAFLQRSEVRLSTLHRVASALLSGAGLMVLLPAIARDSVVSVMQVLLDTERTAVHLLLIAAVGIVIASPFVALFIVLRDLTRFYFHGQHLSSAGGELFVPRFTLTGLRLPSDELGAAAAAELTAARNDPRSIELLVPARDATRAVIDDKLAAYIDDGRRATTDHDRAEQLFTLIASQPRPLLDEVAKVEHGMARHILRLQVIVLRYTKALLAFLTTAGAVFASAAVVAARPDVGVTAEIWLGGIIMVWATGTVFLVRAPVRWIEDLLRSEGASHAAIGRDRELTSLERLLSWIAVVGWAVAMAAIVLALVGDDPTSGQLSGPRRWCWSLQLCWWRWQCGDRADIADTSAGVECAGREADLTLGHTTGGERHLAEVDGRAGLRVQGVGVAQGHDHPRRALWLGAVEDACLVATHDDRGHEFHPRLRQSCRDVAQFG